MNDESFHQTPGYEHFNWERLTFPTLKNMAEWFVEKRHGSILKHPAGLLFVLGKDNIWHMYDAVSKSDLNLQIADSLNHAYQEVVNDVMNHLGDTDAKVLTNKKTRLTFKKAVEGRDSIQVAENVMRMCQSSERNSDLFLSKPHLLAFTDGVFDLNESIFRPIQPDDYIVKTTGYRFPTVPARPEVRRKLLDFIGSIYRTEEEATYIMRVLARQLYGELVEEMFLIHKGNGRNGKGVLMTLVDVVFGEYYYSLSPENLTRTSKGVDCPNSQLFNLYGCRAISASEPPRNEKIVSSILKTISGRDKVPVRTLHGKPISFRVTGLTHLLTNDNPIFDLIDYAIVNRDRSAEYPFTFTNINPDDEAEKDVKQADQGIKELFRTAEYRDAFMQILLETYRDNFIDSKEIIAPPQVLLFTNKNLLNSLPFHKWFHENYIHTGNLNDLILRTAVYDEYIKDHENSAADKVIGRTTFHKELGLALGSNGTRKTKGLVYYVGLKKKGDDWEMTEE